MDSMSPGSIIVWVVFVLVFGVPGIFMLKQLMKGKKEQHQVRSWPVTDGTIADTDIAERKRHINKGDIFGNPLKITVYQPVIHYSYQVRNKDYAGTRYKNAWDGEWAHPERAKVETVLRKYPAGEKVSVHYNPSDPAQAYLEPQASDANLGVLAVFGSGFLVIALAFLGYVLFLVGENIAGEIKSAGVGSADALIPLSATQIKTRIENEVGLTCRLWNSRGSQIKYAGWRCVQNPNDDLPKVIIWSRGKDGEKVDMIEISAYQDQMAVYQTLVNKMIPIVFTGKNSDTARDWVSEYIAPEKVDGKTSTTIQSIPLTIDSGNPYLIFWIGEAK